MPLDALPPSRGLDDFRMTAKPEIAAMLKRLIDGCIPLVLNAPDGSAVSATLWTLDTDHDTTRRTPFSAR